MGMPGLDFASGDDVDAWRDALRAGACAAGSAFGGHADPLGRVWRDAGPSEVGAGTSPVRRLPTGCTLFAQTMR